MPDIGQIKGTNIKRGNSGLDPKIFDPNKELLDAMRIIARQEIDKAPRDITKNALVRSVNTNGTVNITIEGKEFNNIPNYTSGSISPNDTVKVTYPQNQASNMYVSGGKGKINGGGGITPLDIYPIGSIYLSMSATNPSVYFGGDWTLISQGRTLVGVDSNQESFKSSGNYGGAYNNSYTHAHATQNHVLTENEMPAHYHGFDYNALAVSRTQIPGGFDTPSSGQGFQNGTNTWFNGWYKGTFAATQWRGSNWGHNHGNVTDTTQSISTLQPYLVCYIWQRIS